MGLNLKIGMYQKTCRQKQRFLIQNVEAALYQDVGKLPEPLSMNHFRIYRKTLRNERKKICCSNDYRGEK